LSVKCIVDEEIRRDGKLLLKSYYDKITFIGTPSIWQILLESGWEPLNIKALVGGEPVQISLAHELLSDVVNYGIFMVLQKQRSVL
jgi:hypothetical protein